MRPDGIAPEYVPEEFDDAEVMYEEILPAMVESVTTELVEPVDEVWVEPTAQAIEVEEVDTTVEIGGIWTVQSWANPCLNFRPQPRIWSSPLDCLSPGKTMEQIGLDGDWMKVRLSDGREGWVASTYLARE